MSFLMALFQILPVECPGAVGISALVDLRRVVFLAVMSALGGGDNRS